MSTVTFLLSLVLLFVFLSPWPSLSIAMPLDSTELEPNATQAPISTTAEVGHRCPLTKCEDSDPNFENRRHGRLCDPDEEIALQDEDHQAIPTTAKMGNDPCAWELNCRADSARNGERVQRGKALWCEAALLAPPRIRGRKRCSTCQGRGWCRALHRDVIVIRYPTPPNTQRCYYRRRMTTSYYCKVEQTHARTKPDCGELPETQ